MREGSRISRLCAALALLGAIGLVPSIATATDATFVALSDIHLDPFIGAGSDARLLAVDVAKWPEILAGVTAPVVTYGRDTNVPLLDAVLGDAARREPSPDFVVYTGDSVLHNLADRVRAADPSAGQDRVTDTAVKITQFLAGRLAQAFPNAPVLFALGNNDAGCGDYRLEPGGDYLARTFPVMRALVGADRLEADAEATWRAGGYYATRHPTIAGTTVIVLDTVLWSPKYADSCGPAGGDSRAPGDAMFAWLEARLARAAAAGEHVWLVSHIPAGVDAYATAHAKPADAACPAQTVAMWREPYASAFADLMERYRATVSASFAGHIHRDSWRLFSGHDGAPVGFASILPAVSPVYGDAPAYQVFAYDRSSGELSEKTTFAVTSLEQAAAGAPVAIDTLYAFTQAYGVAPYGTAAVAAVSTALAQDAPSPARTLYGRYYSLGHGDDAETDWPVYGCAPGAATVAAFNACRCGPR